MNFSSGYKYRCKKNIGIKYECNEKSHQNNYILNDYIIFTKYYSQTIYEKSGKFINTPKSIYIYTVVN